MSYRPLFLIGRNVSDRDVKPGEDFDVKLCPCPCDEPGDGSPLLDTLKQAIDHQLFRNIDEDIQETYDALNRLRATRVRILPFVLVSDTIDKNHRTFCSPSAA